MNIILITNLLTAASFSTVSAFTAFQRHHTRIHQRLNPNLLLMMSGTEYSSREQEPPVEYAALAPGSSVQIRIGNLEQSRKAWKKRRRSGSPLLVPCSVLDVDRCSTLISSIVYLVQKFGQPMVEQGIADRPNGYRPKDIALGVADLGQYFRRHLKCSLKKHGEELGFCSAKELVEGLFPEEVQAEHRVKVWMDANDKLWLVSRMSRLHGHRLAAQKVLLQFRDYGGDKIEHTGKTRIRREEDGRPVPVPLSAALRVSQRVVDTGVIVEGATLAGVVSQFDAAGDAGAPLLKLSLHNPRASRKSRVRKKPTATVASPLELTRTLKDLKTGEGPFEGRIVKVSPHKEKILVDIGVGRSVKTVNGDMAMERVLGTLCFSDFKKRGRNALLDAQEKQRSLEKKQKAVMAIEYEDDDVDIEEEGEEAGVEEEEEEEEGTGTDSMKKATLPALTIEDFFTEKELKAMDESDTEEFEHAFVDGAEDVNHQDGVEVEEDITHLVQTDKDGNLFFQDPESEEFVQIGNMDDFELADEELDDDDDDDIFAGLTPEERFEKLEEIMESMEDNEDEVLSEGNQLDELFDLPEDVFSTRSEDNQEKTSGFSDPKRLRTGDSIQVYVQAVSKQSSQCILTTHPDVQPMKVVKKEAGASKKLERLIERMGGDIQSILQLRGTECEGVIKATSKTGDWFYVQPNLHDLPVGVAQLAEGLSEASLSQGDSVRVRFDGVDETRGQLAMTVTGKAP